MRFYKYSIFALALLASVSCQKNALQELDYAGNNRKIIHSKAGADNTRLLVKLEDLQDVQALSSVKGVASVEPLFNMNSGDIQLKKQFGMDRWYVANIAEDADIDICASELAELSTVSFVEYDLQMSMSSDDTIIEGVKADAPSGSQFNDPLLTKQWHYINTGSNMFGDRTVSGADVNVKDVWANLTCGDPSIIVAVVDEGVKYSHPDLAANMWKNTAEIPDNGIDDDGNGYIDDVYGYNFADKKEIVWAGANMSGHGTHVAGTIAAVNNNGIGVCGVAGGSGKGDGCRIMSCQIFGNNGGGSSQIVSKAVEYAADMGASIISCSFGYRNKIASDNAYLAGNAAEMNAIHYFEAKKGNNRALKDGNIAIFAAGNENHDYAHYPGAFVDIISVSAFGPDFLPTNYTNYGPGCNIAAPGGEIGLCSTWASCVLSTVPSEVGENYDDKYQATGFDYAYMQGTSMACPHVSGVVALAMSYAQKTGRQFTRDEFKQMILSSTNDIDARIGKTDSKTYVNVLIDGGTKYIKASDPLKMAPYYHNLGTGAIDAWRLMMKIDGVPCLTAKMGTTGFVDLTEIFGTSAQSLTYLDVVVPEETVKSLGLEKVTPSKKSGTNGQPVPSAECYAYEQFGSLYLHPTKVGSGKIIVKIVGGGDHVGGGNNPPGGMEVDAEVSIISRPVKSNNGGWL